jgi:hypothetical protein
LTVKIRCEADRSGTWRVLAAGIRLPLTTGFNSRRPARR